MKINKTVFITGGSTGIGAASVMKFINEGWNVGFMDINVPAAESLQEALNVPDRLLFIEGNTRTPLVDDLFQQFAQTNRCSIEDYWRDENDLYARGVAGDPKEVAEVIYFLASDASSFCTGGHYLVDGGLVAR